MFKKCKVILLPTNKAENALILHNRGVNPLEYHGNKYLTRDYLKSVGAKAFHLYIISNDEINIADNFIGLFDENNGTIYKAINDYPLPNTCKKVIASTYISFLNLPSLTKEQIELYCSEYNKGNKIEGVMVEYKNIFDPEGITIIDDPSSIISNDNLKLKLVDNHIIIKSIKTSWTREEVIELMWNIRNIQYTSNLTNNKKIFNEWIESNL
jgi:hypothetical protein